jgi:hypothetical protein
MRFVKTIILVLMFLGFNSTGVFAQERSFLKFNERIEIKDIQINNIESELISMNLIEGLSLKPKQVLFILEEAKNLKAFYEQCYKKSLEVKPDLLAIYAKMKEQLEEEKSIWNTPLHYQWAATIGKINDLTLEMRSAVEESVKKVEAQLENFQLRALDAFVECVMPGYSDGFIGQAPKRPEFSFILERIRAMPESTYAPQKKHLAQKELNRVKTYYRNNNCEHFNPQGKEEDVLKTFEAVRKMDKVSFELKKDEICKKLKGKIICIPPVSSKEKKIAILLLSEQAIRTLERKANKKNFKDH